MIYRAIAFSALLLFAVSCDPPATQPNVEGNVEGEEADVGEDGDIVFSDGMVEVQLRGGANPVDDTFTASECIIVDEGTNGLVRADEGALELSWRDGSFSLIWDSGQGLYIDDVTGAVDGNTVTFEGSSPPLTVSGVVTCTT